MKNAFLNEIARQSARSLYKGSKKKKESKCTEKGSVDYSSIDFNIHDPAIQTTIKDSGVISTIMDIIVMIILPFVGFLFVLSERYYNIKIKSLPMFYSANLVVKDNRFKSRKRVVGYATVKKGKRHLTKMEQDKADKIVSTKTISLLIYLVIVKVFLLYLFIHIIRNPDTLQNLYYYLVC